MARTIKVSFEYEGKSYNLKFQLKKSKRSDTGYDLTQRDYNKEWWLTSYEETNIFFAAWNDDEGKVPYTFEVEMSRSMLIPVRLRIWQRDGSGVLIDDEGACKHLMMSATGSF